jgi:hypothetical protein
MNGAIPPLPQYAFMTWCSAKAQGQLYLYLLPLHEKIKYSGLNSSVFFFKFHHECHFDFFTGVSRYLKSAIYSYAFTFEVEF